MSVSVPHSVLHSTNFVHAKEEVNPSSTTSQKDGTGVVTDETQMSKEALSKMRRRLTVTGTSETIDGVSKMTVTEKDEPEKEYHATVRCAVTEYCGVSKRGHAPYNPRKKNQDALVMADDPPTNTLLLCVLDGHGENGDAVSAEFRQRLAQEMTSHPEWTRDVKRAAADAIAAVEHDVLRNFRIDTEFSGTTLSMAIIRGNRITGVNIGDSRVVIGKQRNPQDKTLVAEPLTNDHKPDAPQEKERILQAGGRVFAVEYDDGVDGPSRVWLGHMDIPGLAMSRSLGDAVAHTAGVSSEPEFTERELDPQTDKFVLVATDGLWEFVSNEESVGLIGGCTSPADSVKTLVKEANMRWLREEQVVDDTTIISAHLFNYPSS